jgi:hypothetical protein
MKLTSLLIFVALGAGLVPALAESPRLVTDEFMVKSPDPGIDIYVRNKHPAGMTTFRSERTVLFVHGSTYPAETAFDLKLDGLSPMYYMRSRTPDGGSTPRCEAKPDTSAPTTPGRARIAGDRPPTRTALPGSPENRYDAPQIRCSSGESQVKLARWWLI